MYLRLRLLNEEGRVDALEIAVFFGTIEAFFDEILAALSDFFLAGCFAFVPIVPVDAVAEVLHGKVANDGRTSDPDDEFNETEHEGKISGRCPCR